MIKKRILFVNNSSLLGIGTSTILLLLLKYLRDEFDCAVVSDKHSNQLPEALEKVAIRYYALPDRFIFYLPSLINVILRGKYDLVYANGSNERSRGAFWAAKITRRPLIWHIHESLKSKKFAHTIRFADRVIANSNNTAERLRKYANVSNPIVVVNGIDLEAQKSSRESARKKLAIRFGFHRDWLRVVNVGRICPDKNQADVIRVAHEVITRFPTTYFIIVGHPEKDYLDYLKELVAQFGLEQHVIFSGYTPDIIEILQGCDIMLHVSNKESQGYVLLEAMGARLPVVAYNVGGIGETILDGETGYLLPCGDLNGLIQAVCHLIANPQAREQMGDEGYNHVGKNFDAEKTTQAVKDIINQLLYE